MDKNNDNNKAMLDKSGPENFVMNDESIDISDKISSNSGGTINSKKKKKIVYQSFSRLTSSIKSVAVDGS